MLNPELKPGDRVRLLHMQGESLRPGIWGTVKSVSEIFGDTQYSVEWDDGDKENVGKPISRLSLISGEDAWDFGRKKKLKESSDKSAMKYFLDNKDFFKKFPNSVTSKIRKYLSAIRDTSLVNMMEAGMFLTFDSERVSHFAKYKNVSNKKALKYVIDNADDIRNEMIRLSMTILEDGNKEITPSSVSRTMSILANKFLMMYMNFPIVDNSKSYENIDIEDEDDEEYDDDDDY